jgi:anti-sigma B factor antagonist
LLLKQEGTPMFRANLTTCQCEDRVVVAMRGELDVTDAASAAAALMAVAAGGRQIIIDLKGLEFIDSSGLAALVLARRHARRAGGDLLLAAPGRQVLRVLTLAGLTGFFAMHACAEERISSA